MDKDKLNEVTEELMCHIAQEAGCMIVDRCVDNGLSPSQGINVLYKVVVGVMASCVQKGHAKSVKDSLFDDEFVNQVEEMIGVAARLEDGEAQMSLHGGTA